MKREETISPEKVALGKWKEIGGDQSLVELLADGKFIHHTFSSAWWLPTFPGLAILQRVRAFHLVGDQLRDALDPRAT